MKKIILMVSVLLLFGCSKNNNESKIISERTTSENKAKYQAETVQKTILENLNKELSDSTEKNWKSAFWASEVLQFRDSILIKKLYEAFSFYDDASPEFKRSLIQNVYTLFPNKFNNEVEQVLDKTDNSKIFAMCSKYLVASIENEVLINKMKTKFPEWEKDPILLMLNSDLLNSEITYPPIVDLITNNFGKDNFVIFSFQRKNRDYKGITIIKNPDSKKFVRNADGSLFSIPQFARAVTNLPSYITNGNTPQGIFSFQGFAVSSNAFIGPTPNIQLVMPFEASPAKFFQNDNLKDEWKIDLYKNLLPESWKEYFPIYESFYAGKAGRTEIIAHGTTINPDYYKSQIYYPYTPSLGCLTAHETWSEETGELIESDQLKLVEKLKEFNAEKGFFVLVEIDDQQKDVTIADLLKYILKAEN